MISNPATKYRQFPVIALSDRQWPNKVIDRAPRFLSSDLRDGNQALIEPMSIEKKLRMFDLLVECGFKEIEIAFPSASETEFKFVRRLIEENRVPDDVVLQVLTQAREDLIVRTFESLKGCKQAIVHVYNATSPVFRQVVFNKSKEEIKALAVHGATLIKEEAKKYPETDWSFQYSPEIFSDTELDFAIEVCEAVCDVWQPSPQKKVILNLPATVEMSTPNVYADQIEYFCRHISRRESVVISIHVHNDRGCAVAATELAIMAGGDRVEGCLFGHGERTGNVDLITIALNLYTQGIDPTLDFTKMNKIVREVEHCTQLPVHPRHPYAGELVFTAFSGSHQDAIKKGLSQRKKDIESNNGAYWQVPYLPIDPIDLDRSYEAVIRVNSQSGKGGVAYLLEQDHGIEMPRRLQIEFSRIAQKEADTTGKELTSGVLYSIFEAAYFNAPKHVELLQHKMLGEDDEGNTTIHAIFKTNNQTIEVETTGNGPIAAFVKAINQSLNLDIDVVDYNEHARSQGAQASAVSYIEMQVGNRTLFGAGTHVNSSKSSYLAIMSALNRAIDKNWISLNH
ncbi:2-isopropylmalate synthase [Thorsellia kenyensis]|uniref:2-isopropylmalate synthase n=1 Tax=Thorsellia kenyensis TaxID=1549888 RepID=A0ABV6C709_9GAMM